MAAAAAAPRTGAFELRPYQREALEAVKAHSTIVNMPTGTGKTLIAAHAISHFLSLERRRPPRPSRTRRGPRRCLFVVPTRALTSQQAEYVQRHAPICGAAGNPPARVVQLCGQEMESWTQQHWNKVMAENEVLVGTPEVFRRAFVDSRFIWPAEFCLIVYDECHNATGNSPMASIQNDAILPYARDAEPDSEVRVLGLTASFVHGKMSNLEEKRLRLEQLLGARMISPVVPRTATSAALDSPSSDHSDEARRFERVPFDNQDVEEFRAEVDRHVSNVLENFLVGLIHPKDLKNTATRAWKVFEALGSTALLFYLREGLLSQLEAKTLELLAISRSSKNNMSPAKFEDMLRRIAAARARMLSYDFALDWEGPKPPEISNKAEKLLKLILQLQEGAHEDSDLQFRGLIFVTEVSFTYPVAALINDRCRLGGLRDRRQTNREVARPVSGVGSMKDKMREENLAAFKAGTVPLLVSTNALEEGIDVAECSFVIRFDKFETTKSHIQGSGRARNPNARIFYFDNCPKAERLQEQRMVEVARNGYLGATPQDLMNAMQCAYDALDVHRLKRGIRHPFETTHGGLITVFNCLTIFYEYCQMALRRNFDPEEYLFEITQETWDQVGAGLPEPPKRIEKIKYPTPLAPTALHATGWRWVTSAEVEEFWHHLGIEEVVEPKERLRNMEPWDLEKRRFVYVVTLLLAGAKINAESAPRHPAAFLGEGNRPTREALEGAWKVCPFEQRQQKLRLKKGYPGDCKTSSSRDPYQDYYEARTPDFSSRSSSPDPDPRAAAVPASASASASGSASTSASTVPYSYSHPGTPAPAQYPRNPSLTHANGARFSRPVSPTAALHASAFAPIASRLASNSVASQPQPSSRVSDSPSLAASIAPSSASARTAASVAALLQRGQTPQPVQPAAAASIDLVSLQLQSAARPRSSACSSASGSAASSGSSSASVAAAKNRLQEYFQKRHGNAWSSLVRYEDPRRVGPDHSPLWSAAVLVREPAGPPERRFDGAPCARKGDAEKHAAAAACAALGIAVV
eukprot:tig00021135_g18961.t1